MTKRGTNKKFGRVRNQRKALYKALATALINNGKIQTTQTKAKALAVYVNKLITKAKRGDLSSRRLLINSLSTVTVNKLINDIGPKLKDRKGGYTRIIKNGRRLSDGAPVAFIEFTF
jgi:large subunit ribosomal protein L17